MLTLLAPALSGVWLPFPPMIDASNPHAAAAEGHPVVIDLALANGDQFLHYWDQNHPERNGPIWWNQYGIPHFPNEADFVRLDAAGEHLYVISAWPGGYQLRRIDVAALDYGRIPDEASQPLPQWLKEQINIDYLGVHSVHAVHQGLTSTRLVIHHTPGNDTFLDRFIGPIMEGVDVIDEAQETVTRYGVEAAVLAALDNGWTADQVELEIVPLGETRGVAGIAHGTYDQPFAYLFDDGQVLLPNTYSASARELEHFQVAADGDAMVLTSTYGEGRYREMGTWSIVTPEEPQLPENYLSFYYLDTQGDPTLIYDTSHLEHAMQVLKGERTPGGLFVFDSTGMAGAHIVVPGSNQVVHYEQWRMQRHGMLRGITAADVDALYPYAPSTVWMTPDRNYAVEPGYPTYRFYLHGARGDLFYAFPTLPEQLANNWHRSSWFGWLFADYFPWVYSPTNGWVLASDTNGQYWNWSGGTGPDHWFWDSGLGWIYTGENFFPWIWQRDQNRWVYQITDTRWFYVPQSDSWEEIVPTMK